MTDAVPRLRSVLADRYRIERELGQGGPRWGVAPHVSPDGRWPVFGSAPVGIRRPVRHARGLGRTAVAGRLRGAPPPEVTFPKFTIDGRGIMFMRADQAGMPGIWLVSWPAGGKPEPVLRFDDPVRQPYRPYRTLSRDQLFVLLQESESDVWVVETRGM